MRKKNHYILAALAALLLIVSCSESSQPEEKFVLLVDKEEIDLDTQEKATFTVKLDGEDITSSATIINTSYGGYEKLTSNEFTTLSPGTHTFFATYDGNVSETVSVVGTTATGLSNIYYRRNVVFKFTGTWCAYCPSATTAITAANILYPDRLVEIAIHSGDDLEVSGVVSAMSTVVGGVSGYPTVCIDANKSYKTTGSPVATNLVTQAKSSLADEPTTVGIQLESKLDGNTLTVDVENHFIEAGNYKLVVAFLQSGFTYDQTGATDENYQQNHVLRWFFTNSMTGDPLGENNGDCVVGERVPSQYVVELDNSINLSDDLLDTFTIVAYVLKEVEENTYHINNAAEIGINELSDYQYEPITE